MSEESGKLDPWRLVTMVVIVVAFFVGFYLLSGMIDARFDGLEGQLRTTTESLSNDIQANRALISGAAEEAPTPAAAEAPDEDTEAPDEGEAAEEDGEEEAEEGGDEEAEEAAE